MRTTIELPDDLLSRAKSRAALSGISLKQFFCEAIQLRLIESQPKKMRRPPPALGHASSRPVQITRKQIDEAMFG